MNTAEHHPNPAVPTIAPGHGSPAVEIGGHLYAATAEPVGRQGKVKIVVYRDGEVWVTRTSGRDRYAFVNLQSWDDQYTGPEALRADARIAPRYSAKPMRKGDRIEYGHCVGSVAIQRIGTKAERAAAFQAKVREGLPGAARLGRAPATAAVAAQAEAAEGRTLQLVALAAAREAKAAADAAWRHAIVTAHQAGLSDRAIARELGVSHPTVAKIVAAIVGAK